MNHAKQVQNTGFLLKNLPISLIAQFLIKSCRVGIASALPRKKPLPNPPLIREGSKKEAAPSCSSPDKGRLGGVSSKRFWGLNSYTVSAKTDGVDMVMDNLPTEFPIQDALRLELSESYFLLPEISQTLPDRSFMGLNPKTLLKIQQTVPVTSFPELTEKSYE